MKVENKCSGATNEHDQGRCEGIYFFIIHVYICTAQPLYVLFPNPETHRPDDKITGTLDQKSHDNGIAFHQNL